jgi:hypothetical protein
MKKSNTATFIGYACDASYYINNDKSSLTQEQLENANTVLDELTEEYGNNVEIVDCSDEAFFATPTYGSQLKGDCLTYTVFYRPLETVAYCNTGCTQSWYLKSDMQFPSRENPLVWQKQGLSYTATGYGSKIPTTKEVFILNRWRRIYSMVYGNAGSCYVIIENEIVFIEQYNLV